MARARDASKSRQSIVNMPCRIAAITDLHFSRQPLEMSSRKGEWADVLLKRAVARLNRHIKPDVTVILGDLLDDPKASDAVGLLTDLRGILDRLAMPWLVIPGNHDPAPGVFYSVFDECDFLDINGVRLVPFVDPEEPRHCARREDVDFDRMARLAADHDGPRVALQHVPICQPRTDTPYGYTNSEQVHQAMREHGYTLAISGHYHRGVPLKQDGPVSTLVVPAMCEAPYSFALVTVDDAITHQPLQHQLPKALQLNDYHSHTQFAYCAQDVAMDRSPEFAALMGLNQLAFTEHSGQLYFERKAYWGAAFGERGLDKTDHRDDRTADYWRTITPYRNDTVLTGLEVDADFHGNLILEDKDRERAEILLGAVHWLRELRKPEPDLNVAADEFLKATEGLCRGGVHILAHPFRVFRRSNQPVPAGLVDPVVKLLREHGVAAEINFHSNDPQPDLFAACIEAGVRISFGGDAHELYEIGEFHPSLDLLADAGFDGDLADILLPPIR